MTDISKKELVVVAGALHNEKDNVREFCSRVTKVMEDKGENFKIVIVDDGSTDGSTDIIRELSAEDSRIECVVFTRNFGQWAAVAAGLKSEGDWIVVMDTDLQHAPEEIPLLVDKAREDNWDMASGLRQDRNENILTKRIPSRIANWAIRKATGCEIHDMGGFKCIKGDFARELRLFPGYHRFLPALVYLKGGRVTETPITAPPRLHGVSHYGMGRTLNVLFDIISLRFQAVYLVKPLQFLGRIAFYMGGFGSLILFWLMFEKFVYDIPMGTRPPLILSVLFILLGGMCLLMGFIAEIVSNIYFESSNTQAYRVHEVIRNKKDDTSSD